MRIAREACERKGVDFPVRYVHEFEREQITDDLEVQQTPGFEIWTMLRHRPREAGRKQSRRPVKIERHEDGRWECNCDIWQRERGVDCWHIKHIKVKFGYSNVPYINARRRKPTVWLFPKGTRSEWERREDADSKMPSRVPKLAFDAARHIVEQPPHDKTGPIGAELRAIAFGLMMKVLNKWGWHGVVNDTRESPRYRVLGMLKPMCRGSWINRTFDARLAIELYRILIATARTGRNFEDDLALIDSFDMNTVMVDNARDRKFGPKRASYRPYAERVRYHVGVGSVTNLIAGADVSLHYGLGAGDPTHLPSVLRQIKAVFAKIRKLAGDKIYGPKGNFAVAQDLDVELLVRKKTNEHRRPEDGWNEMAQRVTAREREDPDAFDDDYSYRSKVEGTPSSVKRITPQMRLRQRKGDPKPEYPKVAVDGDLDESLTSLEDDVLGAIVQAAQDSVGIARLCEALAILIIHNLRAIVTLEELTDEQCDFRYDFAFTAIRTVRQRDVEDHAA